MILGISIPWYEYLVGYTTAVDFAQANVWIATDKSVT